MCGRYAMNKKVDDLIVDYVAAGGKVKNFVADWQATFSIPPTSAAPIVRERVDEEGTVDRELELSKWGLRPFFMKDSPKPGFHNARLETVADKPSFRTAFPKRRALVPMNGYYEWVERADKKQPYFIHGDGLLSAAGLYEVTKNDAGGEVHDRMPVFLTPSAWDAWLSPAELDKGDKSAMLDLLGEQSVAMAATLTTYPVSMRVNNVRKIDPHDPTLLEPVELDEA
jgi:putative SOS response-associated peptidase YedK